jgi:hypothetical protein
MTRNYEDEISALKSQIEEIQAMHFEKEQKIMEK